MLKIYFNYSKFLENILSHDAVDFLPHSIGYIGKNTHRQKLVIAPHLISSFHCSLDPRRIADQTRPFAGIRANIRVQPLELKKLRTKNGMAGAGVHN